MGARAPHKRGEASFAPATSGSVRSGTRPLPRFCLSLAPVSPSRLLRLPLWGRECRHGSRWPDISQVSRSPSGVGGAAQVTLTRDPEVKIRRPKGPREKGQKAKRPEGDDTADAGSSLATVSTSDLYSTDEQEGGKPQGPHRKSGHGACGAKRPTPPGCPAPSWHQCTGMRPPAGTAERVMLGYPQEGLNPEKPDTGVVSNPTFLLQMSPFW